MRAKTLASIASVSVVLMACEGDVGTKQAVGTLAGAAAGGLIGAQFGGGTGQLAATAAGTLLGAFLGSELGKSLDRADRVYAERTTEGALEKNPSGTTSTWRNPDSGHSGTVTPTDTYYNAQGQPCRTFDSVINVDGRQERVTGRACRQADGSWRVVES